MQERLHFGSGGCPCRGLPITRLVLALIDMEPLALPGLGDYQRVPSGSPTFGMGNGGRLSTAVVHLICNQGVAGSNPAAGTKEINNLGRSAVPQKSGCGTGAELPHRISLVGETLV